LAGAAAVSFGAGAVATSLELGGVLATGSVGGVAAVGCVAGVVGVAAAFVAAVPQFLLVGVPPRLPALIALPVAVHPAPGVEVFAGASFVCASA
jgi:hypothetical protein